MNPEVPVTKKKSIPKLAIILPVIAAVLIAGGLCVFSLLHFYDDGVVTQKPTCEKDGIKTYTCGLCHKQITEKIDATGHTWDNGVVTVEGDCWYEGEKTFTCATCKKTRIEVIPCVEHKFTIYDQVAGGYICEVCYYDPNGSVECPNCGMKWSPTGVGMEGHTCFKCGCSNFLSCYKCGGTRYGTLQPDGSYFFVCSSCGDTWQSSPIGVLRIDRH